MSESEPSTTDFTTECDDEFIDQFEYSWQTYRENYPIIIVPGVAGSKLIARNKQTGQEEVVWVKKALDAATVFSNYCWCRTNPQTGETEEICKDYYDIYAIKGISGCDKIIDFDILDGSVLEDIQFGQYLHRLIHMLKHRFGYEPSKNLFAFTYIWYHNISETYIMDSFHQLVQQAVYANNKKCIIIAHSLGGVLVETYMKMHPYSDDYIHRYITVCTPFDGAGGTVLQSPISGFNMRMPVPNSTAKGVQCSGGVTQFLMQKPKGIFGIEAQVFVKRLIGSEIEPEYHFSDSNQVYEGNEYDMVKLHPEVYEGGAPDTFYILAQEILTKHNIRPENIKDTFILLKSGCKEGAIELLFHDINHIPSEQRINHLLVMGTEKPTKKPDPPFFWECYSPWQPCDDVDCPIRTYEYKDNYYMTVDQKAGTLHFNNEFYKLLRLGGIMRQQQNRYIRDFFVAKQYYLELNIKQSYKWPYKTVKSKIEGPWGDVNEHLQLKPKSVYQLVNQVHGIGTFNSVIFRHLPQNYNSVCKIRQQPIILRKNTSFRFASLNVYGRDTCQHIIYTKPVNKLSELIDQQPEQFMLDGDGTVVINSALSDPFPDELVIDRVCFDKNTHKMILWDERMWDILIELLELE